MCPLTHDTETRRQSHGPVANPSILQPRRFREKRAEKRLEKINYDDGKYTSRTVVSAKSKEKRKHGIMGREHKIMQQGAQCSFFSGLGRINLKKEKKRGFNLVLNSHKFTTNQFAQRIPESRIESKSGISSQETEENETQDNSVRHQQERCANSMVSFAL